MVVSTSTDPYVVGTHPPIPPSRAPEWEGRVFLTERINNLDVGNHPYLHWSSGEKVSEGEVIGLEGSSWRER